MISLTILSSTLAITAALTGIALVGLALWLAGLMSPRSYNVQKGEAYECGIPTRGESMAQFKVGYYLFAILFLMFDVECVFLFPLGYNCRGTCRYNGRCKHSQHRCFFCNTCTWPCVCLAERSS